MLSSYLLFFVIFIEYVIEIKISEGLLTYSKDKLIMYVHSYPKNQLENGSVLGLFRLRKVIKYISLYALTFLIVFTD